MSISEEDSDKTIVEKQTPASAFPRQQQTRKETKKQTPTSAGASIKTSFEGSSRDPARPKEKNKKANCGIFCHPMDYEAEQ